MSQQEGKVTRTSGTELRLPAALRSAVDQALRTAVEQHWARRLWDRDTALWTADEAVAGKIADRLGWLDAPDSFMDEVAELTAFAQTVRGDFSDALVCGMGGSSLAPEVLAQVLPRSESALVVRVLDSTDPAAVAAADAASDPVTTVYVIATKSGTTTETLAFLAHFWAAAEHRQGFLHKQHAGDQFVAVTDPEKSLAAIPHSDWFREVFLNPPDVGGRYSALTYVGLVPGALQGLDIAALLDDARAVAEACRADDDANPGLVLGVAIGALAAAGRDKLTFVIEPELAPLGAWLEQLIAESTGKSGVGVVPVDGEPLATPDAYVDDRVFVRIGRAVDAGWRAATGTALAALEAAGHPVIDVALNGSAWVGGEFFRWEFATAVAGAVLGINPFDEPNVTESKENTAAVLDAFRHDGHLPAVPVVAASGSLRVEGEAAPGGPASSDVAAALRAHLASVPDLGYYQIAAYIAPTDERTAALRTMQAMVRDRTRHATTLGYGPRFLHSTGQLHKGGQSTGCFIQLVAGHPRDIAIPGRKESFGTLVDAQALGDYRSLRSHGLPVLRLHLSDDPDAGLAELRAALESALS
jgi:transaldolase/glucose-6-phosphate isomerase